MIDCGDGWDGWQHGGGGGGGGCCWLAFDLTSIPLSWFLSEERNGELL